MPPGPAHVLALLAGLLSLAHGQHASSLYEALQCSVCEVRRGRPAPPPPDTWQNVQTPVLSGTVQDCCCDFETVDEATLHHFFPVLDELRLQPYFRYFKANLWGDCPFWQDDLMCSSSGCSVRECEPHEVPQPFLEQDEEALELELGMTLCSSADAGDGDARGDVVRAPDGQSAADEWSTAQDELLWIVQDESHPDTMYIDLVDNPERFTGYNTPHARKMWAAIGEENCFGSPTEQCLEKRAFYRIMSGLHASITMHIALGYPVAPDADPLDADSYGPSLDYFLAKLAPHPDRLENMYFTYLVVLRAVAKARPALLAADIDTGNPEADAHTRELLERLFAAAVPSSAAAAAAAAGEGSCGTEAAPAVCLAGFDESGMFQAPPDPALSDLEKHLAALQKLELKDQFRDKFRNISRIMDCLGCEKCRLWGKLQTLGLGTAMKVLFESGDGSGGLVPLERQEAVALVNALRQLSKSVLWVERFRQLEMQGKVQMGMSAMGVVAMGVAFRMGWGAVRRGGNP